MSMRRSGSCRGLAIAGFFTLGIAAGNSALGQPAGKAEPSPFAPGDLSKPVFDTRKSVYDPESGIDKAAGTIIAEIEGHPITLGDIGDAIRALPPSMAGLSFEALFPGVLDHLVKQESMVMRAQSQGLEEDPKVRRRIRAASNAVLANEYLQREAAKGITEAALLERYKRDVAGKPGAEEVRSRMIMVPTQKEAEDLIAELKDGADFATLAKRASKDVTAPTGGDVGFAARFNLNPEVGAVLFALDVGQITPHPVRAMGSWFVLKVEERRRQETPNFHSVREAIQNTLVLEASARLAAAAPEGFRLRQYDLAGQEVGEPPQRVERGPGERN